MPLACTSFGFGYSLVLARPREALTFCIGTALKMRAPLVVAVAATCLSGCSGAQAPKRPIFSAAQAPNASVYLEDLTWVEVRNLIRSGTNTIIIPVGGVEQSGPNLALGKHDARVHVLAGLIASHLGHTLVAPTVSYVPEGSLSPPEGHMRFPGTITVPASTFRHLLSSAAMSLRLAGFTRIVLIGDHGGYQADLKKVSDDLNRTWRNTPARAQYVAAYYAAAQTAFVAQLRRRGFSAGEIGTHAGLADTSLTMALAPELVRPESLRAPGAASAANGVHGDPRRSSRDLGMVGVTLIVRSTVDAIRAAEAGR